MSVDYNDLEVLFLKNSELSKTESEFISNSYRILGKEAIYKYSSERKITPFAAKVISKLGHDKEFWDEKLEFYRKRNGFIIDSLSIIFLSFNNSGIDKIFISENFGALLLSGEDKALFASSDVDLYADISQRERINIIFSSLGYIIKDQYSYNKLIRTSFYRMNSSIEEFSIIIEWNLLSREKLPNLLNADDFIAWNNLSNYERTKIKLPSIESLIYICLLHISLHSFTRSPGIKLLFDVSLLSKHSINWDIVILNATRDKTRVRLLTSCFISKQLLESNVPNEVFMKLDSFIKSVKKVLKITYNERDNRLYSEPGKFKLLYIESLLSDKGLLYGILNILFPSSAWIRAVYFRNRRFLISGYLLHLKNLLFN